MQKVVTGSTDGKVNVYSDTLVLIKSFLAHSNGMITRVLYANGGYVLTASSDYTVNIWDTNNNWSLYATYTGHTGNVYALISISDTVMMSGDSDGNLRQWSLSNGSFSTTSLVYPTSGSCCNGVTFSSNQINGICYMPSLNKIALALNNGLIQLYTKDSSSVIGKLYGYTSAGIWYGHNANSLIFDCVTLDNTGLIATSGGDRKVIIWDVPNYSLKYTLVGHAYAVYGLKFYPASGYLASGSADTTVRLWNAASGAFVRSFNVTGGVTYGFDFLSSSTRWAIGADDYKVKIFEQTNANELQSFTSTGSVRTLAVISGKVRNKDKALTFEIDSFSSSLWTLFWLSR